MFSGTHYFKDGQLIPTARYQVPKGRMAYEVVRLVQNTPLFWTSHYERLLASLMQLEVPHELHEKALKTQIQQLTEANHLMDSNLRINVIYDEKTHRVCHFELGQVEVSLPTETDYLKGVKSGVLALERPDPNIKKVWTQLRATIAQTLVEKKLWDVVLKSHHGELTEGGRTNVFFIQTNGIVTPPVQQVLPGITRKVVLQICRQLGIAISERPVREMELSSFEAAFFTGTSPGILPVQCIGQYVFTVPHPLVEKIALTYRQRVQDDVAGYR